MHTVPLILSVFSGTLHIAIVQELRCPSVSLFSDNYKVIIK